MSNIEKRDRNVDALVPQMGDIVTLARAFHQSDLFPAIKSVAGIITVIEYGREMGLPPAVSLQTMCIVSGRVCIEAKVLLGLFQRSGGKIKIIQKDKKGSKVEFSKEGMEPFTDQFTIEDAEALGFLEKKNWQGYPEEMCYWRCIAKGIRAYDPMVTLGLYTKEEVTDFPRKEDDGKLMDAVGTGQGNEEEGADSGAVAPPPASEFDDKETINGEPIDQADEPGADEAMKALSSQTHAALGLNGVNGDERNRFLLWLYRFQETKGKKYLGHDTEGDQALHFSLGNREDVESLVHQLPAAIKQFRKSAPEMKRKRDEKDGANG